MLGGEPFLKVAIEGGVVDRADEDREVPTGAVLAG
jgi:hypothetical protein